MIIKSLTFDGFQPQIVDVQVSLLPGVPTLHVLGAVEERNQFGPRLKSAFLQQGFQWPKSHQIIVNVRSAGPEGSCHRGVRIRSSVELAVAVGILQVSHQMNSVQVHPENLFCGELSLSGEVYTPPEVSYLKDSFLENRVVSGPGSPGWQVNNLKGLLEPRRVITTPSRGVMFEERPEIPHWEVSYPVAQVLRVVATGEHALMVAGPPGTGKSTFAEALYRLLPEGSESQLSEARKWWALSGQELKWRPKVFPHHSTPSLSMIGGGYPPVPGELTRAHGGLLFLDEYLEFSPRVQEALREPMERGEIRIVRRGQARTFPADALVVAATNLCLCGQLTPGGNYSCALSLHRCRSQVERLNGPMLDRFAMMVFSNSWRGKRDVPLSQLKTEIEVAVHFKKRRGQNFPNSKLSSEVILKQMTTLAQARVPQALLSERRHLALLRVARTLADLEGVDNIEPEHVAGSEQWTVRSFADLAQLFS